MSRAPNLRVGARPNSRNLIAVFMSIDEDDLARLALILAAAESGKGGRAKLAPIDKEDDIFAKARTYGGSYDHHKLVDIALDCANGILDGHGIEAIRGDVTVDRYYFDIVALYVNMGDTYHTTIVYETATNRFLLTDYGTWVEYNSRRYGIR